MAYGSMAPSLMQMPVPGMPQQPDPQAQGMALLKAIMAAKGGGTQGATPGQSGGGVPALLGPGGGLTNMMNGGMGNGLLSKMFPNGTGGKLDPNGNPIVPPGSPDPLSLAAPGMAPPVPPIDPSMAGAGMSPTALTGLW